MYKNAYSATEMIVASSAAASVIIMSDANAKNILQSILNSGAFVLALPVCNVDSLDGSFGSLCLWSVLEYTLETANSCSTVDDIVKALLW